MNKTPKSVSLLVGLTLFLMACDTSTPHATSVTTAQAAVSDVASAVVTGTPSQARTERTFTVPGNVSPEAIAEGLAVAARGKCNFRPMLLPPGTRVRIVEEAGVRTMTYWIKRDPNYHSDRGDVASLGGDPDKGDGIINALHGSLRTAVGFSIDPSDEEEIEGGLTCKCSTGSQNQTRGCTPAYNPRSGHMYCDAYGSCNECTGRVN